MLSSTFPSRKESKSKLDALKKNQSFTTEKWRHFVTGKNLESLQPTCSLWKKEITQENSNKMKKKKESKKEDDLEYIFKYDPKEGKKA